MSMSSGSSPVFGLEYDQLPWLSHVLVALNASTTIRGFHGVLRQVMLCGKTNAFPVESGTIVRAQGDCMEKTRENPVYAIAVAAMSSKEGESLAVEACRLVIADHQFNAWVASMKQTHEI